MIKNITTMGISKTGVGREGGRGRTNMLQNIIIIDTNSIHKGEMWIYREITDTLWTQILGRERKNMVL